MHRGSGPQDSSAEQQLSSVPVNQSQGFDTSAFGAEAPAGTPQPNACEVSPKMPRRRTSGSGGGGGGGGGGGRDEGGGGEGSGGSGGGLAESTLRRSLELERQPTASFSLISAEEGKGRSSSGPINMQPQQQPPLHQHHPHHHQQQLQLQQLQQQSQAPPVGTTSPVRRTRSLKENLIKRFNSSGIARAAAVAAQQQPPPSPKAAAASEESQAAAAGDEAFAFDMLHAAALAARASGGSRSSSPKKAQEAKQQQQPPSPMSRNRAGSLRGGSVVKVLPDKRLLNKASSSENLNQSAATAATAAAAASVAAAADLSSLASLVQKKRDRSQESLELGGGRPAGGRKPPTPTPADSDDGSDATVSAAATATTKSKPPSGVVRGGRRLESPTGRGAAAAAAAANVAADESPAETNDTDDRESPGEDQQSDGEVPQGGACIGSASVGGHNRSNSLEFLMQDAHSRTAPQIRHPSARKIESASAPSPAAARREGSPPKATPGGAGGGSPPKVVSFNPNDEIKTYEGDYSRYRKHRTGGSSHGQQGRQRRTQEGDRNGHAEAWSQGRIGDNALIEVHSAMVESMDKMVSKQRQFLCQVMDGSITVGEYREVMKSLLTMQTKTIHQILDVIQSNEKPS